MVRLVIEDPFSLTVAEREFVFSRFCWEVTAWAQRVYQALEESQEKGLDRVDLSGLGPMPRRIE